MYFSAVYRKDHSGEVHTQPMKGPMPEQLDVSWWTEANGELRGKFILKDTSLWEGSTLKQKKSVRREEMLGAKSNHFQSFSEQGR